jgi:hypothetical protein
MQVFEPPRKWDRGVKDACGSPRSLLGVSSKLGDSVYIEMRFETDLDEKMVTDYLGALLEKEVKKQIERYINDYQTQSKIRKVVSDHLEGTLVDVVVRIAGESKGLEDKVRSTILKRLTNKVVKEMME